MRFATGLTIASVLLLSGTEALYDTKGNPVLTLNPTTFAQQVIGGNTAVMVKFFAPWCGHCKSLTPKYVKAANSLKNIGKFVAINCDEHPQFCQTHGVKGYPTLKVFHPGNKKGEDYQGPRSAKAMAEAVAALIPNHVHELSPSNYEESLAKNNETAKAILFTNRKTDDNKPMPLWRSLAIDFKDRIIFAQFGHKHTEHMRKNLGITKFPTIIYLPGKDAKAVEFDGKHIRDHLYEFFSARSPKAAEANQEKPKEKPVPTRPVEKAKPSVLSLVSHVELVKQCFGPSSKTCILALSGEGAAIGGVDGLNEKLLARGPPFSFQVYKISTDNPLGQHLLESLGFNSEQPRIIAINYRGWLRKYKGDVEKTEDLLAWTDAVKLGEVAKEEIPANLLMVPGDEDEEQVKKASPKVERTKVEVQENEHWLEAEREVIKDEL